MEHSAGIVLFRKRWFGRQYLILQYTTVDRYWGLAKGHVEKGETQEQAALREVQEETGMKEVKLVLGFKEKTDYFFVEDGKKIHKEVVWFLGEVFDHEEVKVSLEHSRGKWVSFSKAMKMMTFDKDKNLVRIGEELLRRKDSTTYK